MKKSFWPDVSILVIIVCAVFILFAVHKDPRLIGIGMMPIWVEYLIGIALIPGLLLLVFRYNKMKASNPGLKLKDTQVSKWIFIIPLFIAILPSLLILIFQSMPVKNEHEMLEFTVADKSTSFLGSGKSTSNNSRHYVLKINSVYGSTYCTIRINSSTSKHNIKQIKNLPRTIELEIHKGLFSKKFIRNSRCIQALGLYLEHKDS